MRTSFITPLLSTRSSLSALSLAAALLVAGPASAQQGGTTATGAGATNTTTAAPAKSPGSSAKVARVDSAFMKQAAQNGNTEVEASKLALTKSSNPQVKTFAQQMIDDHTKTGDELKSLASSKGVELSDKPSMMQSAKIKALDAMSGANFDKRYASIVGVSAHEDTVKLFQKESTKAKDADVKAFADKTLPGLQHHLEMAQALKTSTSGKS